MATGPRVPGVMETARQFRYSTASVAGSNTPSGTPVGIVDDVFAATGGTPGGDSSKIGTASIIPSSKACSVGQSFLLQADYTGNNQVGITYTWTVKSGQTNPASVFQPLKADGTANGAATATPAAQTLNKIQFDCKKAGTLVLQVSIASTGQGAASDTPQTAEMTLVIT